MRYDASAYGIGSWIYVCIVALDRSLQYVDEVFTKMKMQKSISSSIRHFCLSAMNYAPVHWYAHRFGIHIFHEWKFNSHFSSYKIGMLCCILVDLIENCDIFFPSEKMCDLDWLPCNVPSSVLTTGSINIIAEHYFILYRQCCKCCNVQYAEYAECRCEFEVIIRLKAN